MREILLDVQSIGLGVQSTAMALMSGMDLIPRADYYYWSKLRETPDTFEYAEYILPKLKELGVNVQVLEPTDIYEHILSWDIADRVSMIPVWFRNEDGKPQPLNRQCTSDFKIEIVAKAIRKDLNVGRLKRNSIRIWQGISIDEIKRAKKTALYPDKHFRVNHYPFIGQYANITYPSFKWESYSREKIKTDIFGKLGFKTPPKSSCFFCPFHDIYYWKHIYDTFPNEWELACLLDDSIRNYNSKNNTLRCAPFFLYNGLIPLREIDFDKEIAMAESNQFVINGCETGFCFV